MPTGQVIVTGALTTLGINQQGGTPSASDSADALAELNNQWDAWGIDEGLIFSIQPVSVPLTANVGAYTIGPGATVNKPRPARIYKAFFVAAVSTGKIRKELKIVEAMEYYAHGDLTAAASTPDELYPDFNVDSNGYATLRFFPVSTCLTTSTAEIDAAVPFSAWTLVDDTILPAGYQDAINYALAFRLIPRFGAIVPEQVQKMVIANGMKAEERIRAMNAINRKLSADAVKVPNTEQPPPQQQGA